MIRLRSYLLGCLVLLAGFQSLFAQPPVRPIVIGCKQDVEGQVLAEIMAQLLENRGFVVERRYSLGGTLICFEALKRGSIDVYPEYSGTLEQAILQISGRSLPNCAIRTMAAPLKCEM